MAPPRGSAHAPTVLFVGGGTLGHVIPAVAVARALKELEQDVLVHFICSPRGEAAFLAKEKMPHTIFNAPRLSLRWPWAFLKAYHHAQALLHVLKPQVVFSKGGYVSIPVCLAAKRMCIPIVLHESDAVMGRANQLIARWAETVCLGFPEMRNGKCEMRNDSLNFPFLISHFTFTGNPVRAEITQGTREEGLRITGFSGKRPILLIMGGSQGAAAINAWVERNFQALSKGCDVMHLTGPGKVLMNNDQRTTNNYFTMPFAHAELPHFYACADCAISRAGAGSIAELAANGLPTILIPLTGVAHDHQDRNAASLQKRGAALHVTQDTLDKELMNVVQRLIDDPVTRGKLGARIRALHHPDSAGQIAKILSRSLVECRGA